MTIEFPLNSIFEQTFQGHPLADAAWMYYVSAGNRQRVDYFLKDSRGENLVGGQLFESGSFDSVPQLISMFEEVVNKFAMIDNQSVGQFISYLFSMCDWLQNPEDGPLYNLKPSEYGQWQWFAEPESREAGVWLDAVFQQIKKHFRTIVEARDRDHFENMADANQFWDQQVMKVKRNFAQEYDKRFVGQLMGFGFLESDKGQGFEHNKALIPLLFVKISEVATWFYKNGKWDILLAAFDKRYGDHYLLGISYFVKLETKPNERLNMPQDVLSNSAIYEQREFLDKIRTENRELKQSLLTMFAMAGHDFAHAMGPALLQYQAEREESLDARLFYSIQGIQDRIFTRKNFDQDATMDRPNLAYILRYMSETYSEQMFRQWTAAQPELPSQEMLSALPGPASEKVVSGGSSDMGGLFIFAGVILAALVAFR